MVDLSSLEPDAARAALLKQARERTRRPFDLAGGPLYRAGLFRLEAEEHLLICEIHHSVFDGWSAGVFLRELAALYEPTAAGRPSPLPPLAMRYIDYARYQRSAEGQRHVRRDLVYWREALAGVPARWNCRPIGLAPPSPPTGRSGPSWRSTRGWRRRQRRWAGPNGPPRSCRSWPSTPRC